jgi:hypothetical protein
MGGFGIVAMIFGFVEGKNGFVALAHKIIAGDGTHGPILILSTPLWVAVAADIFN